MAMCRPTWPTKRYLLLGETQANGKFLFVANAPEPWTCASMKFTRYQWTIVYTITYFCRALNCEPMRRWNYSGCDVPFSRYELNFATHKKNLFLFLFIEIFQKKRDRLVMRTKFDWQMKRNEMKHRKPSRYKRIHIFCFFFKYYFTFAKNFVFMFKLAVNK